MKLARIACAAAAMLLLAGCSSRQSIEELLRAPQPNEAQSAVQTALSNFLGEPLQLKYPRGGSEMAPLLFLDRSFRFSKYPDSNTSAQSFRCFMYVASASSYLFTTPF